MAASTRTALADVDLAPEIRQWLARIGDLRGPVAPGFEASRAEERRVADALAREFTLPVPDDVEATTVEVGGVPARRYRPAGIGDAAPTHIHLHGGAFVLGSAFELVNERTLARRARDAGVQILSLDYRLAPGHPYPAGRDDALLAYCAVLTDPAAWSADPARIGLGGVSAGATIAASATLMLADRHGPAPIHLSLEVPAASLRAIGESAERYAEGFGNDDVEEVVAAYLPTGADDGWAQPLDRLEAAPMPAPLPPVLVAVAEHDPLRDGGIALAEAFRRAGAPTELQVHTGHLHATATLTARFAGALDWQARIAAELRRAYHPEETTDAA